MSKKRRTRRALINSVISLIICFSMLLGTTFAWFTDSVTSANNIIKAGNLDVEVFYVDDEGKQASINGVRTLFNDVAKWEPGAVAYENLTVANIGSLALKYQLSINFINENTVDGYGLSDVLQVAVVEGGINTTTYPKDDAGRAELVKDIKTWMPMQDFVREGKLVPTGSDVGLPDVTADTETYGIVIYWKPTSNDNNWNVNNMKKVSDYVDDTNNYLHIDLGVNVVATQLVAEKDSFGPDYDDKAEYLPKWDGESTEVPAEVNGTITIATAGELAAFAEAVNAGTSYAGKTIVLGADLNLADKTWTPIGACNSVAYFQGTFDGNGHTIYNLNVDNSTDGYMYSTAGLFGWIDAAAATIKNVNIDDATVKGSHWVGALVGYMTGEVIDCTVTDSTVIGYNVNGDANGDKVGGLVGYMNTGAGKLEGNTVSDTTVTGYRDVAGLAGAVATTNSVKSNTVEDTVVIYEADYAGEIVSPKTAVVVDDTNKAENVVLLRGTESANGVIKTGERSYAVLNKEGLLNVNDIIANASTGEGQGIKVTLMANVDLSGETWKPIDTMWIDFDGNGHTISNLTAEAWKAGFFGYLGGGSIKNLTLENVDVTGSQAGTFAGAIEGTIDNCTLKGNNTVTWKEKHQYDDPDAAIETWSGIGAITGVTQPCTVNATIEEGATVTLNYGAITTEAPYVDELTGYIGTNIGTVTNNGTINGIKTVSDTEGLTTAVATGVNVINLTNGTYELKGNQKDGLTIIGVGDAVKISNLTNFAGNGNLGAIWQNVNFENVIFTEKVYTMADGAKSTFKNCTFEQGFRGGYSNGVTFLGCKFNDNNEGFAMHFEKVYTTVVATECEFVEGTIAFGDNGNGLVTFNNCTFSGETKRSEYFDAWASCVLNDCTFEKASEIWHQHWENGETVTLNNTTGATVIQK